MQTSRGLQEGPRGSLSLRTPKNLGRRPDCAAANLARIVPETSPPRPGVYSEARRTVQVTESTMNLSSCGATGLRPLTHSSNVGYQPGLRLLTHAPTLAINRARPARTTGFRRVERAARRD